MAMAISGTGQSLPEPPGREPPDLRLSGLIPARELDSD